MMTDHTVPLRYQRVLGDLAPENNFWSCPPTGPGYQMRSWAKSPIIPPPEPEEPEEDHLNRVLTSDPSSPLLS